MEFNQALSADGTQQTGITEKEHAHEKEKIVATSVVPGGLDP
jgi:hypothetical protein